MSGDDTIEAALRKVLEADQKLAAEKADPSAEAAALRARVDALNAAPTTPGEPTLDELREPVATNPMKRVSVICLQCGLSVARLIHAETAQAEIDPVTYQRKCKIAPNAADFDWPELERAVERSRRWDPIFRTAASQSVDVIPGVLILDDAVDQSGDHSGMSCPHPSFTVGYKARITNP